MATFLISDTHFGHDNIIRYCDRPFDSGNEMDAAMRRNWNRRVNDDTVLFGGDLSMTPLQETITTAKTLNGTMVLLEGNHDDFDCADMPFSVLQSTYLEYEHPEQTYQFWYSHFPADYQERTTRDDSRSEPVYAEPPAWFDGWNLHGHVHNNDTEEYPFVNHTEKSVNLGVELLEYTPIRLDELVEVLRQGEWYETVSDVPDNVYSTP